ncbi:MAG: adenylyltransferase/cytidyltransferase family protein [Candidatus Latescibacterota bacterium]|nr:MAG: adenylyltransferase/cytidyltransferase family protein [Candidatus Latescibacterota bacterium]
MKPVIDRANLGTTCDSLRDEGRTIVFTNGCFDLLHPGHLDLLARSAACGDVLVVGVNDDASVRRLKGPKRPIYPVDERTEILLALRWVDHVTVFTEDTPRETIRLVRPDVLVKGAEYKEQDIVGARFVRSYGGDVVRVPMKKGYATRLLVQKISKAEAPGS